jgi:hypothetical protein
MEIEVGVLSKQRLAAVAGVGVALLLVALAFLGRAVTPTTGGVPMMLSPARWQAYGLAREAHGEILRLQNDVADLKGLLEAAHPDPVAALLFAQRVKATHSETRGTAVTLPARRALLLAAETAALSASGAEPRAKAIETYNAALEQVQRLAAIPGTGSDSRPVLAATPAARP